MSNSFWVERDGEWIADFHLNNSRTRGVIEMLAVAGSDLAETPRQQALVTHLIDIGDQTKQGLGLATFAMNQLLWQEETFEEDRHFLFQVFDRAISAPDWEALGWCPDPEYQVQFAEHLRAIKKLVGLLRVEDLMAPLAWTPPARVERCPLHRVLLHESGCILCTVR